MTSPTLDRLRRAGLSVEIADGGLRIMPREKLTQELREATVAQREEIRWELLREAAAEALDLVTVDPATGDPDLSAREPATRRQAERLRKLARHPSFGEKRKRVSEIVEEAVEGGLTEAGAHELIGRLGDVIARAGRTSIGPSPLAGGGSCQDCGRDIGTTSTRCGGCKQSSRGPRRQGAPSRRSGPASDGGSEGS